MANQTGFRQGRLGIGKNPIFPLDISGSTRIEGDLILGGTIADINGTPIEFGAATATFNVGTNIVDPHITSSQVPSWSNNVTVEAGANNLNDLSDGFTDYNCLLLGNVPSNITTNADNNVGVGVGVLNAITSGSSNVAIGKDALYSNNNSKNVAVGRDALYANTNGANNVGVGYNALKYNTTGTDNIGIGAQALYDGIQGNENIAIGKLAMNRNQKGIGNISIGHNSGAEIGQFNHVSNYNLIIGHQAKTSTTNTTNEIVMGKSAIGHGSNIVVIGNGDVTAWHPGDDNGVDLGSASYSFKNIYFDGTLYQNGVEFGGGKFEDGATSGHIYYNGGNVGIGTTTPNQYAKLHVNGDSASTYIYITGGGSGNSYKKMSLGCTADANRIYSSRQDGTHGTIPLWFNVSDGSTPDMVIKENGHVGIGTTSPDYKIQVAGNGNAWYTSPCITFSDTANDKHWYVGSANNQTAGDFYIRTMSSSSAYPGENGITIKHSNGNVGIGTTSPDTLLHLKGGYPLKCESGTDSNTYLILDYNQVQSNGDKLHINHNTSNNVGIACGGGSVGIGNHSPSYKLHVSGSVAGSSWTTTSDDRYKHNEKDVNNALETIKKIKIQHYYKTNKKFDASYNFDLDSSGNPLLDKDNSGNVIDNSGNVIMITEETGIIAQTVKNIPELAFCVTGNEQLYLNYNNIFCYNIQATQELDRQQQAYKERITQLETTVQLLMDRITALENNATN